MAGVRCLGSADGMRHLFLFLSNMELTQTFASASSRECWSEKKKKKKKKLEPAFCGQETWCMVDKKTRRGEKKSSMLIGRLLTHGFRQTDIESNNYLPEISHSEEKAHCFVTRYHGMADDLSGVFGNREATL